DPYGGETERAIRNRIREQVADICFERIETSALAEHSRKTNHSICIGETMVLVVENHYKKHKLREAIEIGRHADNLNRDE
ncbi:hypothetical protein KI387_036351, partial [Taxus chinensis]